MVAPVVYLVAAALLVGLIFFLTRRRGQAAAGKGCRRARACGAAFSDFLTRGRPSRRGYCACAGCRGAADEDLGAGLSSSASAYRAKGDPLGAGAAVLEPAHGMAASLHLPPGPRRQPRPIPVFAPWHCRPIHPEGLGPGGHTLPSLHGAMPL